MTREHQGLASRVIAARGKRPLHQQAETAGESRFTHHHFSVAQQPIALQAQAWSERVSGLLDTPMSRTQRQQSFTGEMDSYVFKDMIYLDCRTDPLAQARTLAKISCDNVRDFVFHVAVEGIMETLTDTRRERKSTQFVPGILALDMGQPMRMLRPTYAHVLAFFLPRATVEAEIADADALHGQVLAYTSPLTRLLLAHLVALSQDLRSMPPAAAEEAIRVCVDLLLAAFGKQQRLTGSARSAAQSVLRGQIQRHVQSHLYHKDLTPESVLRAFDLSRPTLYRMFESEGGLGTYIRNCRLREAAEELVSLRRTAVMEIAYGLGFSSASDFTRAFRRAYGMAPQDFRALGLDLRQS
ncbi:AraC family transcriptional regulator [Herbaspirillum sp. NPDC101397]|uniref:AraC family transcriptional regulator n=1 Tax=Herbaspirillum sp. NPDC101397 TaxID=3364006 RepID=UPI00383A1972